ncbi:histone deacetylase [Deinococcus sp. QL22]|uniref:histone deacetylase family protein n=1 Tax=Deinococcus sp. QL22 TaxID=2939437 RepID=UPI00201837BF|nr:histone deacetylase [Deinococcus sp. QL22]UQN06165.1 histone deacetylase [Deinococcus sp. QL22]
MSSFPHPYRAFTAFLGTSFSVGPPPRRQFLPAEFREPLLAGAGERLPLLDAPVLDWALAERVHDTDYLRRWRAGEVTRAEERALGFAWSPAVVERGLASSGATLAATHDALALGLGINLGGGTHHAYRAHAEGFSFLNDVAISAQWLLDEGWAARIAVVDLDVHQGNGTASIFAAESRVLTISVHGANNYPFQKEVSGLDVALPDGTGDEAYLAALRGSVFPALHAFAPDFVFYLAGADVLEGDQLGRLALTPAGVRERDDRVCRWAALRGIPLVLVMAGGYNKNPQTLIAARLGTLDAALDAFGIVGGASKGLKV